MLIKFAKTWCIYKQAQDSVIQPSILTRVANNLKQLNTQHTNMEVEYRWGSGEWGCTWQTKLNQTLA